MGRSVFGGLQVTILEATPSLPKVLPGLSSPFCIVRLGATKARTPVSSSSSSGGGGGDGSGAGGEQVPTWNTRLLFTVSDLEAPLTVQVYSRDLLSRDQLVGTCVDVPSLRELRRAGGGEVEDVWFRLADKNGEPIEVAGGGVGLHVQLRYEFSWFAEGTSRLSAAVRAARVAASGSAPVPEHKRADYEPDSVDLQRLVAGIQRFVGLLQPLFQLVAIYGWLVSWDTPAASMAAYSLLSLCCFHHWLVPALVPGCLLLLLAWRYIVKERRVATLARRPSMRLRRPSQSVSGAGVGSNSSGIGGGRHRRTGSSGSILSFGRSSSSSFSSSVAAADKAGASSAWSGAAPRPPRCPRTRSPS